MRIKTFVFVAALAIPTIASAQSGQAGSRPGQQTNPTGQSGPTAPSTPSGTAGQSDTAGKGGTAGTRNGKAGEKAAKLDENETKLISQLHHVNQMEIDMGKLAQRTGSARVKQYAQTLVKDHQAADKELTALAKKGGVAKIPTYKPEGEAMEQQHQQQMDAMARMKKLKGADFDREFLNNMVSSHDQALALVDASTAMVKDQALTDHLRNQRPILQRHRDQAAELQKGSAEVSRAGDTSGQRGTPAPNGASRPGAGGGQGSTPGQGTQGNKGTQGGSTQPPRSAK